MSRISITLALKRCIDWVVALAALVLLFPLIALIALVIKVESPRDPIFFNDFVMGQGGKKFKMFKFRTMVPHKIDYSNRPEIIGTNSLVTQVGTILRRTKLDELPQFLNVLLGQMSLVGPRPMDPFRFQKANEFQRQRLLMKSGMTGWVQVNGNINWTWEERMEMDVWYIANWSLWLDIKILLATISVIALGERVTETVHGRITNYNYRINRPGQALIISKGEPGSTKQEQESRLLRDDE